MATLEELKAALEELKARRVAAAHKMHHAEAVYAARVAREDRRHAERLAAGADEMDEELRYEEAITRAHAPAAAARAEYADATTECSAASTEYRRALNASHG